MKRRSIRLCAMLLVCTLLFPTIVQALEIQSNPNSADSIMKVGTMTEVESQRFETVAKAEAETMSAVFEEDIVPACSKELLDFSGNAYTLIECEPLGYMIYHNASGQFVEMSASSMSPYSEYDEGLFYGGPTEYYVLRNGVYHHTILDEMYDESSTEAFQESCNMANEAFLSEPATEVLQYIETGTVATTDDMLESIVATASEDTPTYITNAYCISNCETNSEMSYFSKGACGYIAAAMLLLWFRDTIDVNYLDYNNSTGYNYITLKNGYPVFHGNPNTYYDGHTFSYNLWRWHSEFGTSDYTNGNYSSAAGDIAKTLESYVTSKGLDYDYIVDLFPSTSRVISRLDTKDKPYILFGNLQPADESRTKCDHGVIAYGHWNGYILCNFGWEGYSCSSVKGTWGSGYMMK